MIKPAFSSPVILTGGDRLRIPLPPRPKGTRLAAVQVFLQSPTISIAASSLSLRLSVARSSLGVLSDSAFDDLPSVFLLDIPGVYTVTSASVSWNVSWFLTVVVDLLYDDSNRFAVIDLSADSVLNVTGSLLVTFN